jgi:hypothetical protein
MWNKNAWLFRVIPRLLVVAVLLASIIMPVLPAHEAKAAPTYPVLPNGLNYYQTTFPTGLVYSPGWYGTFTLAPKANAILLFDDDWQPDWGRAIFAMPPAPNKQPSGAQGGTTLTPLTRDAADAIIKSYNLTNFEAVDPEILAVMPSELHFAGVWAGDKLANKWSLDTPPTTLSQKQIDYINTAGNSTYTSIKQGQTKRAIRDFDPDRFWVGGTGNWSGSTDNHWAGSTGNASGGASVPTNVDNTFFDANSSNGTINWVVTVDVAANTLSMNWTGATNTPTLAGSSTLNIYGSATFILAMTAPYTGSFTYRGTGNLVTNGLTLASFSATVFETNSNITLMDDYNAGTGTFAAIGTAILNTNGKTVTCGITGFGSGAIATLTLGASILNTTAFSLNPTNLTITANTATINVSGTGAVALGAVSYNGTSFALNGTSHVVTDSPTGIAGWTFGPSGAQTITTTGANVSSGAFSRTGTGQISLTGGFLSDTTGGSNTIANITLAHNTAVNATFTASGGSVQGANVTGWLFPLTVTTGVTSGISMTKDGVTSGNLTATITDMGGSATAGSWSQYGLTVAYGSNTANITYATANFTGTNNHLIAANLIPGQTYHYRKAITSGANTTFGSDTTFTLTMPTVASGAGSVSGTTATLEGDATNTGVASSFYRYFEWWQDPLIVNSTTNTTGVAIGAYSTAITFDTFKVLNYRAVVQVGSVKTYGAWTTLQAGLIPDGGNIFTTIIPMILAAGIVIGLLVVFSGKITVDLILIILSSGLVVYAVAVALLNAFFG